MYIYVCVCAHAHATSLTTDGHPNIRVSRVSNRFIGRQVATSWNIVRIEAEKEHVFSFSSFLQVEFVIVVIFIREKIFVHTYLSIKSILSIVHLSFP